MALPIVLNGIDALLTLKLFSMGLSETNPFMSKLLMFDPELFMILKLFVGWLIGIGCVKYPRVRWFNLLTAGVCVWNGYILFRLVNI